MFPVQFVSARPPHMELGNNSLFHKPVDSLAYTGFGKLACESVNLSDRESRVGPGEHLEDDAIHCGSHNFKWPLDAHI
ncbi:MAG: hypothetical protein V9F03_04805 [Microthrixaceae bacterium]